MLERIIREPYQIYFANSIATFFSKTLTPNQVTLLSGFFGLLILPAVFYGHTLLAIIMLMLSGIFDTLDGTIARMHHSSTPFGSVLDIMMDRLVEFIIIMGLWLVDPSSRSTVSLLMLGSIFLCVTSFLVVGIFTPNESTKGFHYSDGIIERAEAFIFFALMMLFPSMFITLGIVFSMLVMLTTLIRLFEFYHNQTYARQN